MFLDGWNWEDAQLRADDGIHLNWPSAYYTSGWWAQPGSTSKNKEYKTLDARETAPFQSHKDMYLDKNKNVIENASRIGPLAAGIPGIPAVFSFVNTKYGSKKMTTVLAPAYNAAKNGFPVNNRYIRGAKYKKEWLNKYKETARIFLNKGEVPKKGWILKQPDLAKTIKKIMGEGHKGFYTGNFAKKMVESVQKDGGIWSEEDLNRYQVLDREPIQSTYNGASIIAPSLPSSGGLVLSNALNILSGFDLDKFNPTIRKHLIVEALRRAYYERAIKMGDPDFMYESLAFLLSPSFAAKQRESININYATDNKVLEFVEPPYQGQGNDTTHFAVIDKFGNRVAVTQSINFWFGSAFVPKGTGILLNNEMDDFSIKPGTENAYGLIGYDANAIEPGKRMLSSMTPTFLESDRGFVILGTPGGSRIISMILLSALDWINGGDAKSMVSIPRFHHQYHPDYVLYEEKAFSQIEINNLEEMGHKLKKSNNATAEECFEGVSRAMFKFNHVLDKVIFKPVAKGYRALPSPIRKGTGNVVDNLRSLLTFSNNVFINENPYFSLKRCCPFSRNKLASKYI